ncbi:hypothetical protein ID866_10995 [Astraeus odoratus]|nr:hypothetical protein ID866_10995 [Astraeus odoratus]
MQVHELEAPAQVQARSSKGKINCLQALLQGKGLLQLVEDCWRGDMETEAKEDDREDNYNEGNETEGEGDFAVPPALTQEHRDMLSTLMMTLSTLLKEFKGYCPEQWDLQACQVKELEATTKGKEKAAEVLEELSESGEEEEDVKDGNEGGVTKGEGDNRDGDMEMGVAPLASAM